MYSALTVGRTVVYRLLTGDLFRFCKICVVSLILALVITPGMLRLNHAHAANISGAIDPSDVYAMWQEINRGIINYARIIGMSDEVLISLENVEAETYVEKQPRDVYERVNLLRADLEQSLGNGLALNYHGGALLEDEIIRYITIDGDVVTPLTVYLRSLVVFETLLKSITARDPNHPDIFSYFQMQPDEVRRPGDVYILVGMAIERLSILRQALSEGREAYP